MALAKKKRRDSTRILYEILLASKNGVSKTKAVYASNLNFRLIEDYLDFLLKMKYLERTTNGSSYDELILTEKGSHLLGLLDEIEKEIKPFRTLGVRRQTRGSKLGHEIQEMRSYSEAIRALKRARNLAFPNNTSRKDHEYQFSLALLQVYALEGRVADEVSEIERLLKLARTPLDNSRLSEGHAWKSNHLTRIGSYTEALREGKSALEFADKARDDWKVALARLAIAEAHIFLGRKDEPLHDLLAALKFYVDHGDQVGQANANRLIAQVYLNQSDLSGAIDYANQALALFREVGDRVGEDETLRYLGDVSCAQGDYQVGLDYYEQVLKIRREIGNRAREGGALGDIGDVYLSLGQYEKSLDLHLQSLAIDNEVGYRFGQVWDHHDLGETYFNLRNYGDARAELKQALRYAEEIQTPDLIMLCKNSLSTLLRSIGGVENLKDSLSRAGEAAKLGEDCALFSGQILAESDIAMAHRGLGNKREALDHSEKAAKLLEKSSSKDLQEEEIFFNHFLVLRDNKRTSEAMVYLKRAYDKMMGKADKIRDLQMRESFLRRVQMNRSIGNAWKEQANLVELTLVR